MFRFSILTLLVVVSVMGVFAAALAKPSEEGKQLPKTAISADDINRRFVVIGPLGLPLGEVATVDGTAIINEGKGALHQFQVISVNDRGLESPVTLPYRIWRSRDLKKLDPQRRYRLRVYQDGRFAGVPEQAMKETGYPQSHSYCFVTSLVVLRDASVAATPPPTPNTNLDQP